VTRLGRAADVPLLEGRSVLVGERRIAVFRTADGFRAIDQSCPHAGGPLADGIVAGGRVTCPLHGLRFDLATGEGSDGCSRVSTYEVLERDGALWLA
jgi:nitrite reductase (NADH) small subunit